MGQTWMFRMAHDDEVRRLIPQLRPVKYITCFSKDACLSRWGTLLLNTRSNVPVERDFLRRVHVFHKTLK